MDETEELLDTMDWDSESEDESISNRASALTQQNSGLTNQSSAVSEHSLGGRGYVLTCYNGLI